MADKWQEGQRVPKACDDISLHLGRVSSVLVDACLAQQVEERMNLGCDQIAIGSTVGMEPDGFWTMTAMIQIWMNKIQRSPSA